MPDGGKRKKSGIPDIDKKLCKRCGVCIALCPRKVFVTGTQGYPELGNPEACNGCALCFHWCPDLALEIKREGENNGTVTGASTAG